MQCESIATEDQWVILFPGQGSQFVGMGKDFYSQSQTCKNIYELVNEIAQNDIVKLCFNGPIGKLSKTNNLQVLMTATNLAAADYLFTNTCIEPSVVLGHSVGEYSALHIAGSLTLESALQLAFARGCLMQREAKLSKGQMYAIKNVPLQDLHNILNNVTEANSVMIAASNTILKP